MHENISHPSMDGSAPSEWIYHFTLLFFQSVGFFGHRIQTFFIEKKGRGVKLVLWKNGRFIPKGSLTHVTSQHGQQAHAIMFWAIFPYIYHCEPLMHAFPFDFGVFKEFMLRRRNLIKWLCLDCLKSYRKKLISIFCEGLC